MRRISTTLILSDYTFKPIALITRLFYAFCKEIKYERSSRKNYLM